MATYTKQLLSGSVNGRGIEISGTTTSVSTTIHTALTGTTGYDEIWLYATNNYNVAVKLTLEWGGTTVNDDNIIQTLDIQCGLILIIPGLLLNNGLIVKAFADVVNVISVHGYINRIQ